MFRLLPDSPSESFDIWQVSDKNHKPETGVTIDRKSHLYYFCPLNWCVEVCHIKDHNYNCKDLKMCLNERDNTTEVVEQYHCQSEFFLANDQ